MLDPKPDSQTLRMERLFDATPEELWAAWTDPKQYAKWISPFPGLDAEVHELDARKGGKVRFTMVGPDGTRYPETVLTIVVYDPPRELVQYEPNDDRTDIFAGYPMRGTVRFEAVGKQTRMTFEQAGLPPSMPLDMARGGFSSCFDKLAAHLAARAGTAGARVPPLVLERTFDASPQELWSAWTDPKQYAKWLNPAPGIDLVIHEFDVRPGGRVRFDMPQPDGSKNPQEGVFHTLDPFREIVTGDADKTFLLRVTFEPTSKGTRMRVEATGVPPEYHAPATVGWNAGFDKLERVLAGAK